MSWDLQRVCVSLGVLVGGLLAADKALSGFAKTVGKFRLDDHFEVAPRRKNADGRHTTLTAEHSRIPGGVDEEVALYGAVLSSVKCGGPGWTRTNDLGLIRTAL